MIYEGTREIHKVMQADYALGYRQDKPRRVELPPTSANGKEHRRACIATTCPWSS